MFEFDPGLIEACSIFCLYQDMFTLVAKTVSNQSEQKLAFENI